ncbi:MAG: hypothetical protein ORN49_10125, partial [Rhodobacteraceae bacterium]|nr:hypothetical protein [Paracoccaceae bacterium]
CARIVLVTDHIRPAVDPIVDQRLIPEFFCNPEFFRPGYAVKLSMFHRPYLPADMPCVFLDLDTLVVGDLGRIADLVRSENDYFMLPPGNPIGFGGLRWLLWKLSGGEMFGTGNSSIVAFHSGANPNLAEQFQALYAAGARTPPKVMVVDDAFISWAAQGRLRKIPVSLGVMFRREFLSRSRLVLELKCRLPWAGRRRSGIVAITFNGVQYKPEAMLKFVEGQKISDSKGRFGYWSDDYLGGVKAKILSFCMQVRG